MSASEITSHIVDRLKDLSVEDRQAELHRCCGSTRWANLVAQKLGSLTNDDDLFALADTTWSQMSKADILEAFSHHPQIGADPEKLKARFQHTHQWSANEQSGMSQANEAVIQRLASGNAMYLERFGYIFIVCATGKSAQEMLDLLEARVNNDPIEELQIAAGEQAKITKLRLEKL